MCLLLSLIWSCFPLLVMKTLHWSVCMHVCDRECVCVYVCLGETPRICFPLLLLMVHLNQNISDISDWKSKPNEYKQKVTYWFFLLKTSGVELLQVWSPWAQTMSSRSSFSSSLAQLSSVHWLYSWATCGSEMISAASVKGSSSVVERIARILKPHQKFHCTLLALIVWLVYHDQIFLSMECYPIH